MGGIEHSTPVVCLLLVAVVALLFFYLRRAQAGAELFVRRIPGIDAVDDAVGRSVELGRPAVFTTGLTSVGPVLYAVLGVLHYVAKRIAALHGRMIVPQNAPDAMVIVEDAVRDAYREAGRSSAFDPQTIVYLSDEQFAFASGYMGILHREQAASAFLFGTFAAESLILAEAGQQVGAMQVGATVSPEQVAFFICTCDYTLIGEELFGASAYLSKEPVQLGSLCTQDAVKMIFFGMMIIGVGIATAASLWPGAHLSNIDSLITFSWDELYSLLTIGTK